MILIIPLILIVCAYFIKEYTQHIDCVMEYYFPKPTYIKNINKLLFVYICILIVGIILGLLIAII